MARIGVAFTGGLTPPEGAECVRLAEALGYESAWVADGRGGDQFALLAACPAATTRIRLGTGISSGFVRVSAREVLDGDPAPPRAEVSRRKGWSHGRWAGQPACRGWATCVKRGARRSPGAGPAPF
ncbi:MAG: hypothetical protein A3K12_06780 [Candidatus Rokubacteria bacterium RIFCSPLOWO2_12_FULL_71_19]|nr:MAG: hypothetical protein A3K12_06780 [Candidatus Rokubacteria bacterium RIFCSPLOWO2_12_FULL_71_19]